MNCPLKSLVFIILLVENVTRVVLSLTNVTSSSDYDSILVYRLDQFPKDQVALHFPCIESNKFATNCACHVKCIAARLPSGAGQIDMGFTSRSELTPTQTALTKCANAMKICHKYRDSLGCKYVLLRGHGANMIATLKRGPNELEKAKYVTVIADMAKNYKSQDTSALIEKSKEGQFGNGVTLGQMISKELVPSASSTSSTSSLRHKQLNDLLMQLSSPTPPLTSGWSTSKSKSHIHYNNFCFPGGTTNSTLNIKGKDEFFKQNIALVALNYRTPMTLLNSLLTWESTVLLSLVAEKIAILNDPLPHEVSLAMSYGCRVVQPKDIKNVKTNRKPNVVTIGAAFYYSLTLVKSEYVLFLESDFKMDTQVTRFDLALHLVAAAGLLDRGAEVIRLMSRKGQGCGTFKDCQHGGIHLDAPDPVSRMRNWFAFYCPDQPGSEGRVADCLWKKNNDDSSTTSSSASSPPSPWFRCFTSWDSNWSLNAAMFHRINMLSGKKYPTEGLGRQSIGELGLSTFNAQDGFEMGMGYGWKWQHWAVPICIAMEGLFFHEEIETSA